MTRIKGPELGILQVKRLVDEWSCLALQSVHNNQTLSQRGAANPCPHVERVIKRVLGRCSTHSIR